MKRIPQNRRYGSSGASGWSMFSMCHRRKVTNWLTSCCIRGLISHRPAKRCWRRKRRRWRGWCVEPAGWTVSLVLPTTFSCGTVTNRLCCSRWSGDLNGDTALAILSIVLQQSWGFCRFHRVCGPVAIRHRAFMDARRASAWNLNRICKGLCPRKTHPLQFRRCCGGCGRSCRQWTHSKSSSDSARTESSRSVSSSCKACVRRKTFSSSESRRTIWRRSCRLL